jgi:lipopolysaccharide transport system permease protein
MSNLMTFALQLSFMLCFWVYFKYFTAAGVAFGLSGTVVFLPLVVAQIALLSLGVGLWLSALTAKYRDFALRSAFINQIWMYAMPVIYSLSQIPERWRWLAIVNPMTMPVEALKNMFLGRGVVAPTYAATSVGLTLVTLLCGLIVFSKVEKTFIDTV